MWEVYNDVQHVVECGGMYCYGNMHCFVLLSSVANDNKTVYSTIYRHVQASRTVKR